MSKVSREENTASMTRGRWVQGGGFEGASELKSQVTVGRADCGKDACNLSILDIGRGTLSLRPVWATKQDPVSKVNPNQTKQDLSEMRVESEEMSLGKQEDRSGCIWCGSPAVKRVEGCFGMQSVRSVSAAGPGER